MNKKLFIRFIYISLFMAAIGTIATSCKTKEGCEINQKAHVQTKKNGKKKGKTKSNLFSKKMRKKL